MQGGSLLSTPKKIKGQLNPGKQSALKCFAKDIVTQPSCCFFHEEEGDEVKEQETYLQNNCKTTNRLQIAWVGTISKSLPQTNRDRKQNYLKPMWDVPRDSIGTKSCRQDHTPTCPHSQLPVRTRLDETPGTAQQHPSAQMCAEAFLQLNPTAAQQKTAQNTKEEKGLWIQQSRPKLQIVTKMTSTSIHPHGTFNHHIVWASNQPHLFIHWVSITWRKH